MVDRLAAHKWEVIGLLAVLAGAGLVRVAALEAYPYSFVNDEGEMGVAAQCILDGRCTDFFDVAWAAQPRMAFIPTAISVWLFGNTAAAARLPSALFGVAAVLFTMLFAREAFGRRIGVLAGLVLAVLPVHVHFSRLAVDNVVDATYSSVIIWLLYRSVLRNSIASAGFAGLASTMAMLTYPGSRLSIALGVGMTACVLIANRNAIVSRIRVIGTYAIVFLTGAIPIGVYYLLHPEHFGARLAQENIFTSGILRSDAEMYGSTGVALLRMVLRSILPYFASNAEDGFYSAPFAYLPLIGAAALVIGIGTILGRPRDPRTITLSAWFFTAILLVSALTSAPPSHERMMNSMPALAILVAIGITRAATWLRPLHKYAPHACAAVLAAVLSAQQLYAYFVVYDRQHAFENSTNELTYETRTVIRRFGAESRMYLIGDPFVYRMFANFDYFNPHVEKVDFNEITAATLAALQRDKGALFIAVPERVTDLERVARHFPGSDITRVDRFKQPDTPLYFWYYVPQTQE